MNIERNAITVEDLRKSYPGVSAVDGISFRVEAGEIFGLVGPNGSGKTTTIECIEGLRQPDSGRIEVLGLNPLVNIYQLRERIGIQLQEANLPRRIRVEEALDLFASFYSKPRDWHALVDALGLADKRRAFFSQLSGGQKQRLFVALALINQPEVVFLDELTTGLDPRARHKIWDLVRGVRKQGTTIFMTTHYMDEAERLCDRVGILDQGRMIALDSPSRLVDSLGMATRITFQIKDQKVAASPNGGGRASSGAFEAAQVGVLDGVQRVEENGDRVTVYGQGAQLISSVVGVLEEEKVQFSNLRTEQADLEDVFLALTGREVESQPATGLEI
jgi:ABC-2 type transport system ATP-binding protein